VLCAARRPQVGDRFDTDVRAGLSARFATCLVTSGCHNMDTQQHYRTDPVNYFASGVGELVPIGARHAATEAAAEFGPFPAAPQALPSGRMSVAEAAEGLQAWLLQQSSLLTPGRADATRQTLRDVLRLYFDAVDENGARRRVRLQKQCPAQAYTIPAGCARALVAALFVSTAIPSATPSLSRSDWQATAQWMRRR
jgi:hypothetical protein